MQRTGWGIFLGFILLAGVVASFVLGVETRSVWVFGLVLLIFLVGFSLWSYSRIGFSWTMRRNELLDELSDDDTNERTARELVREEELP